MATGLAAAKLPLEVWSGSRALHTMLASWRSRSAIAFSCAELEALFLVYDTTTIKFLAFLGPLLTLALYGVLLQLMHGKGAPYRSLLPPLALPVLFHLLPAATVLALLIFKPAFYRKYRRAISFGFGSCFTVAFRDVRKIQLWLRLADPAPQGSLAATLQGFTTENVYITIMWLCVAGHPSGPLFDLILMGTLLVRGIAGNAEICASPLWPAQPITLASGTTTLAKSVTGGVSGAIFPFFHVKLGRLMTCPGALAFWQVVGCWLALVVSGILEMSRRRAFLRTREAREWLGPELACAGLRWPFENSVMWVKVVPAFFWLTLAHVAVLPVLVEA